MTKKKVTVEEFNKDFFNSWKKITKVTPVFEEWHRIDDDDESVLPDKVISGIDLEFDNGEKLRIVSFSNKDDYDDEVCSGLKIIQYKAEEVNWRTK